MNKTIKRYEAPRAEVIEVEYQGILCVSDGGGGDGITGTGFQFGTTSGSWGSGSSGSSGEGFQFGTSGGHW